MTTKQTMPNQHIPLHFIYGERDCCLCKADYKDAILSNLLRRCLPYLPADTDEAASQLRAEIEAELLKE